MVEGRRPSIGPGTAISADQVARRSFVVVRRGFDPNEVRAFLEWVAAGVDGAARREDELCQRIEEAQARIADAEDRAANPTLDEPTLTSALGQETAKVLRSAHEAASELSARAEENAARLIRQAEEDAARLHERAASVLNERTEEAEAAVSEMRRAARSETTTVVADARREAESMVERAREECREMVRETQELRARILGDLARRRRVLYTQVEQLRAGKGSLAESLTGVRRSVDQIQEGLRRAEDEARVAADTAARRVANEPEPTGEELVRAARQLTEAPPAIPPVDRVTKPAEIEAPPPAETPEVVPAATGVLEPAAAGAPEGPSTPGPDVVSAPSPREGDGQPAPTEAVPAATAEEPAATGQVAAPGSSATGTPATGPPATGTPVAGTPASGRLSGPRGIGAPSGGDAHGDGGELVRVIGAFPGRRPGPERSRSQREPGTSAASTGGPASTGSAASTGGEGPPERDLSPAASGVPSGTGHQAPAASSPPADQQRVASDTEKPAEAAPRSAARGHEIPGRSAHPAVIAAERASVMARRSEQGGDLSPAKPERGAPLATGSKSSAGQASDGQPPEAAGSAEPAPESRVEERRGPSLRLLRRGRSGGRSSRGGEGGDEGGERGEGAGAEDAVRVLAGQGGPSGDAASPPAKAGAGRSEADDAAKSVSGGPAASTGAARGPAGNEAKPGSDATGGEKAAPSPSPGRGRVPDEVGEEAVNALFARIRASRAAAMAQGGADGTDRQKDQAAPEPAAKNGRSGGPGRASGGGPRPGGRGRRSRRRAAAEASSDAGGAAVATMERASGDKSEGRKGTEAPETTSSGPPVKPLSADEEILQRRDDAVEPVVIGLSRKLKRALQDEQNDLLDRLRSRNAKVAARDVLLTPREQKERYWGVSLPFLKEAVMAGATFAGASEGAKIPDSAAEGEAAELAAELVAPLRRRTENGLDELAAGDEGALMDHVSAAYREWKGQRVERLAGDHVVAAFSRGALAATPEGAELRWIVDDDGVHCPDCDDNALAGPLRLGERYPTGQVHPPAHSGCRCLLTSAPT